MAKEPCPACGSLLYHRIRYYRPKDVDELVATCSDCGHLKMTPCYDDVFLGSGGGMKTDPMLVDPKTQKPIPFHTKQDKAIIMKMLGRAQSPRADRHHGYRNEMYLNRKKYFEVS